MNLKLNETTSEVNSKSEFTSTIKSDESHKDPTKEYEGLLQQMESETREHIGVLSLSLTAF